MTVINYYSLNNYSYFAQIYKNNLYLYLLNPTDYKNCLAYQ
jgi:hypothetical protein